MFRTPFGKNVIFAAGVGSIAAALTGTTLYAFELDRLINNAQSQINNLSLQISKQEESGYKKIDQFLNFQEKSDKTISKLSEEISHVRTDLEMAYLKKENTVRDVLEEDFKRHLKLLVSAHDEHLNDELQSQYNELKEEFEQLLKEQFVEQKNKYCQDLKASFYKLHEIEKTLQVRKKLDKEELKGRKLWAMCQMLRDILKNSYSSNDAKSLKFYISSLNNLVKDSFFDNQLLINVFKSINEKSDSVVYTEDKLIERFNRVKKLCSRVALVKEDDASLIKYMISFVQSLLIFENQTIDPNEVEGEKIVDINKWNTFSILSRINYCLNQRNLEQSLRYANLLTGAPAKIANEWINDLRTHLELRQAINIIEAQAATYTIRSLN